MAFQISIKAPEEIIPRLGKQELHWKKGRSAFELSSSWMRAGGIPGSVQSVLHLAPDWIEARLLEGIFERETALPGGGRPSQTDLLGLLALRTGNGILAVEGKVNEPFGPLVGEWLASAKSDNRKARLAGLCKTLDIAAAQTEELHYQLLHRTCAAIYEAKRFRCDRAVMLVHSFADILPSTGLPACYQEFSSFASAVALPVDGPNMISPGRICEGVEIRLAWVCDRPA